MNAASVAEKSCIQHWQDSAGEADNGVSSKQTVVSLQQRVPTQSLIQPAKFVHIQPRHPAPAARSVPPVEDVIKAIKDSRRSRRSQAVDQRRCVITQCTISDCKLRTHRQPVCRPPTDYGVVMKFGEFDALQNVTDIESLSLAAPLLPQGGVEWFPSLPLEQLENLEFRELFHHFLTTQYDIISALLVPPSTSESERRRAAEFKQYNFEIALSTPIYCLNYITWAHFRLDTRRVRSNDDKTAAKLHTLVMKFLRAKLTNHTSDEIRELIPIVMTLVVLDLAVGRHDSLLFHREATKHIVAASGGFHNLGNFIIYAQNLDQILSTNTGLPPLFSPMPVRGLERPLRTRQVYGSFFDSTPDVTDLDDDVIYFCSGICRAVEVMEASNLTFDSEKRKMLTVTSTDVHYFYFLRNHLHNLYCHVQSRDLSHSPRSMFVLLATKIVDYMVLMDNYIVSIPVHISKKLQKLLEHEDLERDWSGHDNVLVWILFVMSCVRNQEGNQRWILNMLITLLNEKYDYIWWPLDWREIEMTNLRTFAWSHKRLDSHFGRTCDALDRILLRSITRCNQEC